MEKQYKKVGQLSFDSRTPDRVCEILESYNRTGREQRLRLYYGDTETGRCWMEEHDTIGYIGRSTGSVKIPLLIHNSRSMGGGAILDHCIVKITANGHTLYEHPNFNMPEVTVKENAVLFDGDIYAICDNERKAERLAEFMIGERNIK